MPVDANPGRRQSRGQLLNWSCFGILLICGFLFFLRSTESASPVLNDFVEYWSAGKIFLEGGNPYDRMEQLTVQRGLGENRPNPLMMWNPPWTLVMVAPLALIPYQTAQALWLFLSLLLLLWAAGWFWEFLGGPASLKWIGFLGAAFFIPNGTALYLGQITPFLLFGLAGFFWAVGRNNCFLAGIVLSLITIKPHVLYLLWIFLLLWVLREGLWKTLAGLLSALSLAMLAVSLFDGSIAAKYIAAMASGGGPLVWQTPTWGVALRMLFPESGHWMRFVPMLAGISISVWLWLRWRTNFTWHRCLAPILLLSVITSSFTWTFDWVVLTPVFLVLLVWFQSNPKRLWWLPAGLFAIECVLIWQPALSRSNFYGIWMPPALAVLLVLGRRFSLIAGAKTSSRPSG